MDSVAKTLVSLDPARVATLTTAQYSRDYLLSLLYKDRLTFEDFCALLSPSAEPLLQRMAQRSQSLTLKHFGRVIQLYVPLYLSNACVNQCLYCGFQTGLHVAPIVLSKKEMSENYAFLANQGFGHILLLTGEHPQKAGVEYLVNAISSAKEWFPYVSLEVFPGTEDDYRQYCDAGARSVTLYQETYDPILYALLHPKGPKADYAFRLSGPERALAAGMRHMGLGALLGLRDWRLDGAYLGLHTHLLQQHYWRATYSVSFPRIRPISNPKHSITDVSDKAMVQLICATRLFLPHVGLTLSTRESSNIRDKFIHIGITHISAGSNTHPGGYLRPASEPGQFETSDNRSVLEVMNMLTASGFDPVLKDWSPIFESTQITT